MKTKEKEVVFVGVDVSKDTLDVYRSDTGEHIHDKFEILQRESDWMLRPIQSMPN